MIGRFRKIGAWPTTVKVPLIVAILMVAVSAVLSRQILVRLSDTQHRHVAELTGTFLDGLSSAIVPFLLRDDVWEIYDQLDRTRHHYVGINALNTIVATPDGVILAASNPRLFPTQTNVPALLEHSFADGANLVLDEHEGRAFVRRALSYQNRPVGWIYAEIDIRHQLAERRDVLIALVLTNAVLTLAFAGFGYLVVRHMMRPIGILTKHLDRGRGGQIEPIPEASIGGRHSEFGRFFRRYNAMVKAVNQREALATRLAQEERMASLGRLASGMAHEINNPLGGMLNAIDTIERHEHDAAVRRSSLAILKRGLIGIRDVVRATLVTYKYSEADRRLRPSDLDDLRILLRQEASRRDVRLAWRNELPEELNVPAGPVRQAVLNLLLNACSVSPMGAEVEFHAGVGEHGLHISVADRGPGLPVEMAALLASGQQDAAPPVASRGLGTWMVNRLIRQLRGDVRPCRRADGGTRIEIVVPLGREEDLRRVA